MLSPLQLSPVLIWYFSPGNTLNFFPNLSQSLLAQRAMFEHVESFLTGNPPSYQVDPELEKALDTLLQQKAYMSGKIGNPPPAVQ